MLVSDNYRRPILADSQILSDYVKNTGSEGVRLRTTYENKVGLEIRSSNFFSEVDVLNVDVPPGLGQ